MASCLLLCVGLFALTSCSSGSKGASSSTASTNANALAGAHMAGPAAEVHVSAATIANKPKPWVLSSPESAVRSYLDWTSYAYRIATSDVASPTMGADEGVRIDSYIQLYVEKNQLIDQTLSSITFGTPSVGSTSTLVPAKEQWSYRYVSTKTVGKTVGGPYEASYDTTYTVVKSKNGGWVVYKLDYKPLGTVK